MYGELLQISAWAFIFFFVVSGDIFRQMLNWGSSQSPFVDPDYEDEVKIIWPE